MNTPDLSKDDSTLQKSCDEKNCVTCFQNRGCIYDFYRAATSTDVRKTVEDRSLNQTFQEKRA